MSLFGGNISVLESLLVRGRREAIIRMREKTPNADAFVNVQYSTTILNNMDRRGALPIVEIYISSTAIYKI